MSDSNLFWIGDGHLDFREIREKTVESAPPQDVLTGWYLHFFQTHPEHVLRLFLELGRNDAGLGFPSALSLALQQYAGSPEAIDVLRKSLEGAGAFRGLLQTPQAVPALDALYKVGILPRYIPELEALAAIHNASHSFNTLEHTMYLLRHFQEDVWSVTKLLGDFPRDLFLLGALFHDIGKVEGIAGHAGAGAEMSVRIMRRLGYGKAEIEVVYFLVINHLILGDVASGFMTHEEAAVVMESLSNLQALYALTIIDMRSLDEHGRKMMDRVYTIDRIYRRLSGILHGDATPSLDQQESEILLRLHRNYPRKSSIVQAFAHAMPPKFWVVRPEEDLLEDLAHLEAVRSGAEPIRMIWDEHAYNHTTLRLYCPWTPSLFYGITRALADKNVNILRAIFYTSRQKDCAFFLFHLTDVQGRGLPTEVSLEDWSGIFLQVLKQPKDLVGIPLANSTAPDFILKRVRFKNHPSRSNTKAEIEAANEIGVLAKIAGLFTGLEMEIEGAEINTQGYSADDTFYVTTRDGQPIDAPKFFRHFNLPELSAELSGALFETDKVSLPPGEAIRVFKNFLNRHRLRLRVWHLSGGSGTDVVAEYTNLIDVVMEAVFRYFLEKGGFEESQCDFAVLAIGGYGREELNIHSDIDLLFVHRGNPGGPSGELIPEMVRFLFDLRLPLSHTVRSVDECVEKAAEDRHLRNSLLSARYLLGARPMAGFLVLRFKAWLEEQGLEGLLLEEIANRNERIAHHENSPALIEPNVKECLGGLRDIHVIYWVSQALYQVRTLRGLHERGKIDGPEFQALLRAQEMFFRIRNELHFMKGRKADILDFTSQKELAGLFGFVSEESFSAQEKFMREFYFRTREIARIGSSFLESELDFVRSLQQRSGPLPELEGPFVIEDGRISLLPLQEEEILDKPALLWEAFHLSQRMGLTLAASFKKWIRVHHEPFKKLFPDNREAAQGFLTLLKNPAPLERPLRALQECGLIHALIPEFEGLLCLVQSDYYHHYTADEHTLRVVLNLHRLGEENSGAPRDLVRVYAHLERPELLLLAGLLHDIGKSFGHSHVEQGLRMLPLICRRLGLTEEEYAELAFLVKEHLLLSHASRRRDVEDPELLFRLREAVGSPWRLDALYLLTWADGSALSPFGMDEWHRSLLQQLYRNLVRVYQKEHDGEVKLEKAMEVLLAECTGEAAADRATVKAHLHGMNQEYVWNVTGQEARVHARFLEQADGKVQVRLRREEGFLECLFTAPDRPHLFADFMGVLFAHQARILQVSGYTRRDGRVMDIATLELPEGGEKEFRVFTLELERKIQQVFSQDKIKKASSEVLQQVANVKFPSGHEPQCRISLSNEGHSRWTLVEIVSDRVPGLPFVFSKALSEQFLTIHFIKISRDLDLGVHVFGVTWEDGLKVDPPLHESIASHLRETFHGFTKQQNNPITAWDACSAKPATGEDADATK